MRETGQKPMEVYYRLLSKMKQEEISDGHLTQSNAEGFEAGHVGTGARKDMVTRWDI